MKRWMIAYGENLKAAQKAVAAIEPYVDYVPVCSADALEEYNAITLKVDPTIKGISINVSEAMGENQSVEIVGQDDINLLYAVADFKNVYLPLALHSNTSNTPYFFNKLFSAPLKPYNYSSAPKIRDRGIWLWGHTVFDYRRFIDNMVDLKLNTLIVWNDFLPINLNDIINYAHENGVKIILGFAWGWDQRCDKEGINDENLISLKDSIVKDYKENYKNIGCDGIYFQSFTELASDNIGGIRISEAVTKLVNMTADEILKDEPDLYIQFGLHATSVKDHLDDIAKVDPRVTILWEDVGAFPFHYIPNRIENFDKTLEDTRKIRDLRSAGFGAVLKGVICLNWDTFEHIRGNFSMGMSDRKYVKAKLEEKKPILRYIQSAWIKNAKYAQELIKEFKKDSVVTCLVEEGVLEEAINYPTAIYAALLWDSDRDIGDILYDVAQRPDVDFI